MDRHPDPNRPSADPTRSAGGRSAGDPTRPLEVHEVTPPPTPQDGETLRAGTWSPLTAETVTPETGAPSRPEATRPEATVPADRSRRRSRWSPRTMLVGAAAAVAAAFGLGALTGHELTGSSGPDAVQQQAPAGNQTGSVPGPGGQQGGLGGFGRQGNSSDGSGSDGSGSGGSGTGGSGDTST